MVKKGTPNGSGPLPCGTSWMVKKGTPNGSGPLPCGTSWMVKKGTPGSVLKAVAAASLHQEVARVVPQHCANARQLDVSNLSDNT